MNHEQLDFWFPFIVFSYGFTMTMLLNSQPLMALAEKRFPPEILQQWASHRYLAVVCLVIGALWSLQNLLFNTPLF